MEFCCTSSSSVLGWNMQEPSGGPPLTPISGNCRCFSPSVSRLLPVHLGTLVTSKFMMILVFILYRPHQITESFESKLAGVGNPLDMQLSWYLHWLSVGPGPLKQGACDQQLVCYHQKAAMSPNWIVTTWHFSTTLTEVFPCFFPAVVSQVSGCYMQRWCMARTLPM